MREKGVSDEAETPTDWEEIADYQLIRHKTDFLLYFYLNLSSLTLIIFKYTRFNFLFIEISEF